jgi:hypothetical protein
MARGSTIPGHILTTHLPPPRTKKGYGPLVHREIYFKTKNLKATLPSHRTCLVAFMASTKVVIMNFEPEEDDLMGDDTEMDDGNAENLPTPTPKLKSTIMEGTSQVGDGGPHNSKRIFIKEIDGKNNSGFAMQK